MTTLLMVCGSLRRESFNARLLRHLARGLEGRCALDVLEPRAVDLPLFDQDLEDDPAVAQRVAAVHRRFAEADAIVVASPEYNGQPTPYLKNLVDWISRLAYIDPRFENPFRDRPVLLCSASTGWSGGAVAIPHARALFGYVGCLVLGDAICIPHAAQAWDGDAYRFDPFFDAQIDAALERCVRLGDACARGRVHLPVAA